MNYNWEKIGNRIKAERKAHGMSMNELAEEIGTTRQTISKWEKGEGVEITLNVLLSLCNVFDCELGYLLCEFECRTRDEVDICEKTGLSPEAVQNLLSLYKQRVPKVGRVFDDKLLCEWLEEYDSEEDKDDELVDDLAPNHEYDILYYIEDVLRNATAERKSAWTPLTVFAEKYRKYKQSRLRNDVYTECTGAENDRETEQQEAFFLQKYMFDLVENMGDLYVREDSLETWERKYLERIFNKGRK